MTNFKRHLLLIASETEEELHSLQVVADEDDLTRSVVYLTLHSILLRSLNKTLKLMMPKRGEYDAD